MPNVRTLPVSIHPRDIALLRRSVAAMEQRMAKMETYIEKMKLESGRGVLGRPNRRKEE